MHGYLIAYDFVEGCDRNWHKNIIWFHRSVEVCDFIIWFFLFQIVTREKKTNERAESTLRTTKTRRVPRARPIYLISPTFIHCSLDDCPPGLSILQTILSFFLFAFLCPSPFVGIRFKSRKILGKNTFFFFVRLILHSTATSVRAMNSPVICKAYVSENATRARLLLPFSVFSFNSISCSHPIFIRIARSWRRTDGYSSNRRQNKIERQMMKTQHINNMKMVCCRSFVTFVGLISTSNASRLRVDKNRLIYISFRLSLEHHTQPVPKYTYTGRSTADAGIAKKYVHISITAPTICMARETETDREKGGRGSEREPSISHIIMCSHKYSRGARALTSGGTMNQATHKLCLLQRRWEMRVARDDYARSNSHTFHVGVYLTSIYCYYLLLFYLPTTTCSRYILLYNLQLMFLGTVSAIFNQRFSNGTSHSSVTMTARLGTTSYASIRLVQAKHAANGQNRHIDIISWQRRQQTRQRWWWWQWC